MQSIGEIIRGEGRGVRDSLYFISVADLETGMWTIDPIDGTKGFLRGEQYAVCLSLIVDAQVVIGVIGCPNLPVHPGKPEEGRGCIFVAVRGQGAEQVCAFCLNLSQSLIILQLTLSGADPTPLTIPPFTPESLNFLESVEAAHASHSFNDRVSSLLNISRDPIRMDSQAKYGCLARGEGGVYLRMPTGVGYREKIWVYSKFSLGFLILNNLHSLGPRSRADLDRRSGRRGN